MLLSTKCLCFVGQLSSLVSTCLFVYLHFRKKKRIATFKYSSNSCNHIIIILPLFELSLIVISIVNRLLYCLLTDNSLT
jgi:hypothetical protein